MSWACHVRPCSATWAAARRCSARPCGCSPAVPCGPPPRAGRLSGRRAGCTRREPAGTSTRSSPSRRACAGCSTTSPAWPCGCSPIRAARCRPAVVAFVEELLRRDIAEFGLVTLAEPGRPRLCAGEAGRIVPLRRRTRRTAVPMSRPLTVSSRRSSRAPDRGGGSGAPPEPGLADRQLRKRAARVSRSTDAASATSRSSSSRSADQAGHALAACRACRVRRR